MKSSIIKIDQIKTSIDVMVIDETPRDWRFWKAFTRVVSRQNDLALRIYAALLESKKEVSSRDITALVDAPLYSVRRALSDLHELNLISRNRLERGHMTFDYWTVQTPILGILRLIPKKYFRKGYPTKNSR